jgi:hypothetical protein
MIVRDNIVRKILYIVVSIGLLTASFNYIMSDCVCVRYWFEKYIEMPVLIILSVITFIEAWREYIKEIKK